MDRIRRRVASVVLRGKREEITGVPVKVSAATLVRGSYSVSASGATNQQLDVTIQWPRPSMAQWYDVYFDTVNPPVAKVSNAQAARTYVPTLALDTTYYFRINSGNSFGETTGDVLSFSTWASSAIETTDAGVPVTSSNGEYIEVTP